MLLLLPVAVATPGVPIATAETPRSSSCGVILTLTTSAFSRFRLHLSSPLRSPSPV